MVNHDCKLESITWKEIGQLIWHKLWPSKPSQKTETEPQPEPEDKRIIPDMFDRSHLHDWHNRTLADLEPIPEVEAYKNYIRMESAARHQRMLDFERQQEKERREQNRRRQKQHKDQPSEEDGARKKKKKHKTKYQSHRKRGGR